MAVIATAAVLAVLVVATVAPAWAEYFGCLEIRLAKQQWVSQFAGFQAAGPSPSASVKWATFGRQIAGAPDRTSSAGPPQIRGWS